MFYVRSSILHWKCLPFYQPPFISPILSPCQSLVHPLFPWVWLFLDSTLSETWSLCLSLSGLFHSLSRMPFDYVKNRFYIKLSVLLLCVCVWGGIPLFVHWSESKSKSESQSVLSESLWAHGLLPARLLWSWNSPDKNARVVSHSFLQRIFPTQRSNTVFMYFRLILYHLSHQGSPSQIFYVKCVIRVCFLFPKIEQCICIWTWLIPRVMIG